MKIKRILTLLLIMFMVVVSAPTIASASAIKLNKTKATLEVGKSTTLKVNGTKKAVKWSSSNKKIATVNKNGKVTAKKYGTVTITATVGSTEYKCKINTKYDIDKMKIDAYNWIVSDLWNDSFCNIYHYVESGTDAIGQELDIEDAIENADKAMKKAALYDDFIKSLKKSDYEDLKETWSNIRAEVDMLYETIKDETPRPEDETYEFNYKDFNKYMYELMNQLLS